MFSTRRLAVSSLLAYSLFSGLAQGEDGIPRCPCGRILFGPTGQSTAGVGLDLEIVWTAYVDEPNAQVLDLSTDIHVQIGDYSETRTVQVLANRGAGACSDNNDGQPCGTGSVGGRVVELICLDRSEGSCQFPWIRTKFPPVPFSMFGPGDQIEVSLTPSPGSQPEVNQADDFVVESPTGPIFYDRFFRSVELEPVPGTPDVYDIVVEFQQAYNTSLPPLDFRTDIVMEQNGQTTVFEPWCGPWLIDPSSLCGAGCDNQTCAVIKCDGQTVASMYCQSVENAWGQFPCACVSEPIQYTIPSVSLKSGDCLVLSLRAPAGAMPDPQGLDQDQWIVCSNEARSATYGQGKAGTLGVPTLDSIAPPIPGQVSGIEMKEALPGADPILFLGLQRIDVPFDGGRLLVAPVSVIFLSTPVAPDGTLTLQGLVPAKTSLCGVSVSYQLMFMDPGAGGSLNLAMTNGLNHVFGW